MSGRNGAGADTASREMKDPRPSAGNTKDPGAVAAGRTVLAMWETLRKTFRGGGFERYAVTKGG
jgi:hypothetical protein